jgi:uncharacterized protein YqfA (UPF0365 family)
MMKITINIQEELHLKLKQFIPSRKISQFISDSIKKELDSRETVLLTSYQEAYGNTDRSLEANDWDILNLESIEWDKHQQKDL